MHSALLLDIGDVMTAPLWRSFDLYEERTGKAMPWRGPFGPGDDPIWQRHLDGELDFFGYWKAVAAASGWTDWKGLFREVSEIVPEHVWEPSIVDLVHDARAAGRLTGVLTNDGVAINGREWFDRQPIFQLIDVFVDARSFTHPKPDPEPYLVSAERLGVPTSEIVFLDDTPACVEGARAVGMTAVLVAPLDKGPAIAATRELLGLPAR